MQYSTTLTTAAPSNYVCDIQIPDNKDAWYATVLATGTWGGATLNLYLSNDGGVTLVPYKTITGSAYTATANDSVTVGPEGQTGRNTNMKLYAALSPVGVGATVLVQVNDNRG